MTRSTIYSMLFLSYSVLDVRFFFSSRRRHTRWPRDWSSDVCSSDLYEGPSGIVGVLAVLAQERGLHAMSLWAAVPHYVAQPPSPKATLALMGALEELVGEPLPLGDLRSEEHTSELQSRGHLVCRLLL